VSVITKKISRIKWGLKNIERANRRAANKGIRDSLGLIRKRARQNEIRKAYGRKRGGPIKKSRPGERPFAHEPEGLRTIAYEYDYKDQSGIVGPVLRSPSFGVKNAVSMPNAIEFGSRMSIKQYQGPRGWHRVTRKSYRRVKDRRYKTRTRTVNVQKRPFMVPALEHLANEGKIAKSFKGTWE
jgi:hypothetical protein